MIERTGINTSKCKALIVTEPNLKETAISTVLNQLEKQGYYVMSHEVENPSAEVVDNFKKMTGSQCITADNQWYVQYPDGLKPLLIIKVNLDNGLH